MPSGLRLILSIIQWVLLARLIALNARNVNPIEIPSLILCLKASPLQNYLVMKEKPRRNITAVKVEVRKVEIFGCDLVLACAYFAKSLL